MRRRWRARSRSLAAATDRAVSGMGALYAAAVAYIGLHLAIYFAYLRGLPRFRQEGTIFLYHAVSCGVFSAAVLLPGVLSADYRLLVAGVGLAVLHAIYSISFLELWSLSQISYSIAMLAEVARRGAMSADALVRELAPMGEAKKEGRLESLGALGLVRLEGGRYRLTERGKPVAGMIRMLRWLANYRDTG